MRSLPLLLLLFLFVHTGSSPLRLFLSSMTQFQSIDTNRTSGSTNSDINYARRNSNNELTERSNNFFVEDADAFGRGRNGLMLGKDRELFHASIDLRRAWAKLTDRESWVSLFQRVVKALSHVSGADENQQIFKEIAIELLTDIRKNNPDASIKLFQGTLKQAENYARRMGRFIVVYIEDGSANINQDSRSWRSSEQFRKALSESTLGNLLNDHFVFFAGSSAHSPTNNIAKLLGYAKKDLPLFAILSPSYVEAPIRERERNRPIPEVIVTLRLSSSDIDSNKIARFLQRVLEVHGPLLLAKKRELDELLSVESQISSMSDNRRQSAALADEKLKYDKENARRRAILLRQLPPECPRDRDAFRVTISLKSSVLERRFLPSDTAYSILVWADAHAALNPNESELISMTKNQQQQYVIISEALHAGKATTLRDLGVTKETGFKIQGTTNTKK